MSPAGPRRALAVLAAVAFALPVPGCLTAAPTRSSSCDGGGTVWTVDYTTSSSVYGVLYTVRGMRRADGAGEQDASSLVWELRWDNAPQEFRPAAPADPAPFHVLAGPLAGPTGIETRPVAVYLSPRLVAPDGSCTVYLAPFGGRSGSPRVGVLGDSLVGQLNDSGYNRRAMQGYVEGDLARIGVHAEVEGQGGRRWTEGAPTGLARADTYLLDEFRGLLEHDADAFVVALGANDAMYVATGADPSQLEARLNEVRGKLGRVLAEMRSRTPCLAVVTAPEHPNVHSPGYATAAKTINDVLRLAAVQSGTDSLRLVDFAERARTHRAADPAPWFGPDDLHLNDPGRLVYTAAITEAVRLCEVRPSAAGS